MVFSFLEINLQLYFQDLHRCRNLEPNVICNKEEVNNLSKKQLMCLLYGYK